uniref:Uncharacterized protein n=1 Tax=Arundo donax TaxID=35708 RepID=A0A0A9CZL0_ARUDO
MKGMFLCSWPFCVGVDIMTYDSLAILATLTTTRVPLIICAWSLQILSGLDLLVYYSLLWNYMSSIHLLHLFLLN